MNLDILLLMHKVFEVDELPIAHDVPKVGNRQWQERFEKARFTSNTRKAPFRDYFFGSAFFVSPLGFTVNAWYYGGNLRFCGENSIFATTTNLAIPMFPGYKKTAYLHNETPIHFFFFSEYDCQRENLQR
jgi:hypothetical protein